MPVISESPSISASSRPKCALCGGAGKFIYYSQRDRLFGAAGSWNLKRCSDPDCGLIWLDPMPAKEEIWKAYRNYYTHSADNNEGGCVKNCYRAVKMAYIGRRFGYAVGKGKVKRLTSRLFHLFPVRRAGIDQEVRFLACQKHGRLLDVGCGSGGWLWFMQNLGWNVEGVDFDEKAIERARRNGVCARVGALEDQHYDSETFDAITLNHVIEHLPDPVGTVEECYRLLRPGGRLVISTPNAASLTHRIFGEHWRGLEPPRHLHLFTGKLLERMCSSAGFQQLSLKPHVAESVIRESLSLVQHGSGRLRMRSVRDLVSSSLAWVEHCLIHWKPAWADCIAVIAVK